MDNPETLTTQVHKTARSQTKQKYTTQKTKTMNNTIILTLTHILMSDAALNHI